MAVLAIFTGNTNRSQYEALRREVNWEKQHPPGGVFHAASFDGSDRIHVADVWESADEMKSFVEQRLVPAFKKLGLEPPDVDVYPIHNLNAYRAIEKYTLR